MNRLQKKCIVASAGLHALLAAVLLVGPAFLAPPRPAPDLDVLTVIPETLVDASLSNPGSNPRVTQRPPPQPQPLPPPPPPRPVTQPEPPPPKPEPVKEKPVEEPDVTKPAVERHRPTVNPNLTVRPTETKPATPPTRSQADSRRQARQAINRALATVNNVVSSSTSVEIPGPGAEAFASYSAVVKTVYTRAWIEPRDVQDDSATTKASVTIRRDGTVEDARIIQPSGNASVDASVRRTLESVTFVAPFPTGAKGAKRTFTLSFNLKAKRQLG